MAHEGNLRIGKVKQRCRDFVWWPGIDQAGNGEAMVKDSTACLVSGKTGPPPSPPLQPLQWPSKPWDHIQLDICGELHGIPHHQRFRLVAYNLHSKWPEVIAVGSVTTCVVADFPSSLFARWGLLNTINIDNCPQLIAAEFVAFVEERGIKHIRMSFYRPEINGGVERLTQFLKNGIRTHLAEGLPFPTALLCTFSTNGAMPRSTTGSSPSATDVGLGTATSLALANCPSSGHKTSSTLLQG